MAATAGLSILGADTHQKDTFECLYMEGERGEGKMMTILLHPHIVGRASRTGWLDT
jgi:hypothetical protein